MSRIRDSAVDFYIRRGKKRLGLGHWEVTWAWGHPEDIAENVWTEWLEYHMHLIIDRKYFQGLNRQARYRLILHEMAHVILAPIWRVGHDWMLKLAPQMIEVFDENSNTAENQVIGHLLKEVLHE